MKDLTEIYSSAQKSSKTDTSTRTYGSFLLMPQFAVDRFFRVFWKKNTKKHAPKAKKHTTKERSEGGEFSFLKTCRQERVITPDGECLRHSTWCRWKALTLSFQFVKKIKNGYHHETLWHIFVEATFRLEPARLGSSRLDSARVGSVPTLGRGSPTLIFVGNSRRAGTLSRIPIS